MFTYCVVNFLFMHDIICKNKKRLEVYHNASNLFTVTILFIFK